MRRLAGLPAIGAGLLAIALSGCTTREDFARPSTGVVQDTVLPTFGLLPAAIRGEPVSLLDKTDDEKDLRGRAWHFLMPIEEGWLPDVVGIGKVDRILPPDSLRSDVKSYYAKVLALPHASTEAFATRLLDDVNADTSLIGPLQSVAERVDAIDTQRLATIASFGPDKREAGNIVARVAENRSIFARVHTAVGDRINAYVYAAQRLAVEAPSDKLVEARNAIFRLQTAAGISGPALVDGGPVVIRARYAPPPRT